MRRPPRHAEVEAAFSLFAAGEAHPVEYDGGAPRCRCARCHAWELFLYGGPPPRPSPRPVYEVITAELVDGLASWLRREQRRSEPAALRVVEVGAGDGALTLHLRAALAGSEVSLVATDSGVRAIEAAHGAEVLRLEYQQALGALAPSVVLCCWMPLGEDWTASFRACRSVQAYVLIGEADDGCCGRPWATWGYVADGDDDVDALSVSSTSSSGDDSQDPEEPQTECGSSAGVRRGEDAPCAPALRDREGKGTDEDAWRRVYQYAPWRTPWGADGWERFELTHISARQVCRTDAPWCSTRHSKTVVFRRKTPRGIHAPSDLKDQLGQTADLASISCTSSNV
ncbi:hypothetical protein AB1Y20_005305 [Prymnesium parvum]|uniref:Methyltransferase domain-containing protein n=1 Tax=Prymnesium parvum TaxID=97485 RepID=A0AB34J5U6_PRYPA